MTSLSTLDDVVACFASFDELRGINFSFCFRQMKEYDI